MSEQTVNETSVVPLPQGLIQRSFEVIDGGFTEEVLVQQEAPTMPQREFKTAYQHYIGHGLCYRTACVELYGQPINTALGSSLTSNRW